MTENELPKPRPTDLISASDAAVLAGRTSAAIRAAIKAGRIQAIKMPGKTGQYWLSYAAVRALWPKPGATRREEALKRLFALTDEQQDEILGFTPNVAGVERRPRPITLTGHDDG